MDYLTIKLSHSGFAYLSGLLFCLRFGLFYIYPKAQSFKPLKILPHIIDTFLLGFAIWLLVILSLSPLESWVLAKIIALLAYIGFGVVAIKRQKVWAFLAAFSLYVYILGIAHQHHIFSWWLMLKAP